MESIERVIDTTMYKLFRLYNPFEPISKKKFNLNTYRLINAVGIFVIQSIIVVGLSGIFVGKKGAVNAFDVSELVFFFLFNSVGSVKIIMFVYKANDIYNLFDVTNADVLASELCRKHAEVIRKHRDIRLKHMIFINVIAVTTTVQWCLFPIVLTTVEWLSASGKNTTQHFINIFNLSFPVTACNYNSYYVLFYFIEFIILAYLVYSNSSFNTLFISFSCIITAQYEAVGRTYENLNYKQSSCKESSDGENHYPENCYDDILSIVYFQQKIFQKLKMYYSIVWFVYLSSIIINSGTIIIITYWFGVILTSTGSISIFYLIKLISAFSYFVFELFFLCYLMEKINTKKESITFSMFSSNWCAMNLKSKKMLLLAMHIENANKCMIKMSPKKLISLQLYANVMMTSYNIVSVLLKSRSKY